MAKTVKKPFKKRDKERTQAAICQAALECFTRNGADRTTLLEIAKRARVPTSLIHYYFGSQEALFSKVFELVLSRIQDHVTPSTQNSMLSPDEALFIYIRAHFDWARLNPAEFAIWMYFYYASSISPNQRELNTRVREGGRSRVLSLILAGTKQGVFKPTEPPEELAVSVQALVTGAWVMGATENPLHVPSLYAATEARIRNWLGMV